MLRPDTFSYPHTAFRNTPYLRETIALLSPPAPATANPGPPTLLSRGQIVWTRSLFSLGGMPARTVAFVDGIGLISLDPRWLVPADTPAAAPAHQRPAPSPSPRPHSVLRSVS